MYKIYAKYDALSSYLSFKETEDAKQRFKYFRARLWREATGIAAGMSKMEGGGERSDIREMKGC